MSNTKPAQRILIVDDHAGIRDVFIFHMQGQNFIIGEAEDGVQAMALVRRLRPDLIVLDLLMPSLNGCAVLDLLQEEGYGDIPVIVMTGMDEAFDKDAILRQPNVVDYLIKPFSYDGLAKRIRNFIAKGVPAAPLTDQTCR